MRSLFVTLAVAGLTVFSGEPVQAVAIDDIRAGYQAYRAGSYQEAADAFGRAVMSGELLPEQLAITINNRGAALAKAGDYDAAIAEYLKAQDLAVGNAMTRRNLQHAYVMRGSLSATAGNWARAVDDLGKALEIEPDSVDALLQRGLVLAQMGDVVGATADLRHILLVEPSHVQANTALATLQGTGATASERDPALAESPGGDAPATVTEAPSPSTGQDGAGSASMAVPQAAEPSLIVPQPAAGLESPGIPHAAPSQAEEASPQFPETAPSLDPPPQPATASALPGPIEAPIASADEDLDSSPAGSEMPALDMAPPRQSNTGVSGGEVERLVPLAAPAPPPAPPSAAPAVALDTGSAPAEIPASLDQLPQPGSGEHTFRVLDAVSLRAGPGTSFDRVGVLNAGDVIRTDSQEKGWYRLTQDSQVVGWVHRRWLGVVE